MRVLCNNTNMSTALETPVKQPIWHGVIVSTPGTCGGKPRIDGTRICVQDIYYWHEIDGDSVEEIMEEYPHLSRSGIYAALSYFWDHEAEIKQHLVDEQQLIEQMMAASKDVS